MRAGGPRVAVVAYTEYPWDARVRREAEALVEDGYTVHAIALRPSSGPSGTHLNGVHLHELPLLAKRGGKLRYAYQYAMFFLLSTAILVRLHGRRRFEVVHVHSLPDFQVLCALPLRVLGAAVLLDLHEAMPEIVAARFRLPRNSPWVRVAGFLEQLSCRFADHVIAANEGIRSAVISRGVPATRITAVYNAGDPPGTLPSIEALRRSLDLPSGRLIVHAGGINPERDLETLVRAMARLPAEADAHLLIAGDGEPAYLGALRVLAEKIGVADRVRFVGRLTWDQAVALMSLSSVGLVTLEASPLTEIAWPTRILEFASLGKPLVVPRLRFLQDVLGDGAQYYAPGDPESLAAELRSTLLLPEARRPAIAKAAQVCRRFEWSRMRTVLLTIVRNVEGSHAG